MPTPTTRDSSMQQKRYAVKLRLICSLFKPALASMCLLLFVQAPAAADCAPPPNASRNDCHDSADNGLIITVDKPIFKAWAKTGNISQIGEADIEQLLPTHPNEIFQRAPGTWISRGNGQEHLTAIRSPILTGAGSCGAFLYLEDGLPIRPAGFCNVNNLLEVNTEQAGSIQVIRGPASTLFGANALHGVINTQSRPFEWRNSHELSLTVGPYDYAQMQYNHTSASENDQWRFDVLGTHSNGYRDDSGYGHQKLSAGHQTTHNDWRVTTRTHAALLNQETAGFVLGFESYTDPDLRRSNSNPEAFRDAKAFRASSQWQRSTRLGELTLVPYGRSSDMDFLMHFLPGQPLESNGQDSAGLTASLRTSLSQDLDVTYGATVEVAHVYLREYQAEPLTTGSAFLQETRPQGWHYDYTVDNLLAAIFANSDWAFAERWHLTNSLRLESLHYDYDNRMLTGNTRDDGTVCGFGGCLANRPADRTDTFNNLAVRAGVRYRTTQPWEVYAVAGSGFRPPQTTELYRLQRQQTVADLDSEQLYSFELGAKGTLAQTRFDVALFVMNKKNFIFRDADGFNVSDGKTRHLGLEFDVNTALSDQHAIAFTGTLAKHTYRFDRSAALGETILSGNDVDTAPRRLANLRWIYTPNEAVTAELEGIYMGRYYLDAANAHEYDGHELLNLRVAIAANQNQTYHVNIINLANEKYAERADFAFGNYRYFPGMPRQIYVGGNWRWP